MARRWVAASFLIAALGGSARAASVARAWAPWGEVSLEDTPTIVRDVAPGRFLLCNDGPEPIWFLAFPGGPPLNVVERLTADGWVATSSSMGGCSTGVKRVRLGPGQSVGFFASPAVNPSLFRFLGYDETKPPLESLASRVVVPCWRGEAGTEGIAVSDGSSAHPFWPSRWPRPR